MVPLCTNVEIGTFGTAEATPIFTKKEPFMIIPAMVKLEAGYTFLQLINRHDHRLTRSTLAQPLRTLQS